MASPHTSSVSPPPVVSARLDERVHSTPQRLSPSDSLSACASAPASSSPSRGDDAHLQLAAAAPFAHDEVAQPRAPVGRRADALLAALVSTAPAPLAPAALAALRALAGRARLHSGRARAIPGGEALLATPAQRDLARLVAALGGEQAVVHRRHAIAAGGGVKAAQQLRGLAVAVADGLAEGVLELVAVAPLLDRGHDLLQLVAVEPTDALERLVDLRAA